MSYQEETPGYYGYGIYQQRYTSAGVATGGEVRVNATTTYDQQSPSVTALADGGWLVSWTSYNQDGSYGGIYQQRFDASGLRESHLTLTGDASDSVLRLASAAEGVELIGGAGADTLAGGAFADRLSGGTGADTFEFAASGNGTDRITDFEVGDRIAIAGAAFSGHTITDGNGAALARNDIQVSHSATQTVLHIGTDTVPGAGVEIVLDGLWDTAKFVASGNQIRYQINSAPVLDPTRSPALASVAEDAGAPAGAVGTLVSALVDFASPVGPVDNVTDVDAGALLGIALTGTDTANGSWFYSTDNGANWLAVGAVSDGAALLLAADANTRLYFQPTTANFNGTVSNAITFRAWDQSSGSAGSKVNTSPNGGVTAFSTSTDTASIVVSPVNDAPTLTGDLSATVNEGASVLIQTADLGFSDPDDVASGVSFSVTDPVNGKIQVSGVDASSFTGKQLAAGLVSFLHVGSETTTASFKVSVEDGNEDASTPVAQTFNLTVNPVNDPATGPIYLNGHSGGGVQWLQANTAFITDVEGVNPASLAYTWYRNGVALATGSDPRFADPNFLNQRLYWVRVDFLDLAGNAASLISEAIDPLGAFPGGSPNEYFGTPAANVMAPAVAGPVALYGYHGADTLGGTTGADWLDGGAGTDSMSGGAGNDTYIVHDSTDWVIEAPGAGTDTVLAYVSYTLAPEVEHLTLLGSGAFNGSGNTLANRISGNGAANTLLGGGGNDSLDGGDGTDILDGGAGADVLGGGAGNDSRRGGDGNDTLRGGNGNDTLSGGAGQDLLVLDSASAANAETISGFAVVEDTVGLLRSGAFTALPLGPLAPGAFWIGVAAHDADDRIVFNNATGALLYDADGNGGSAAVQVASLVGLVGALSAVDFVVV